MLNEIEEFKAYTDKPEYSHSGKLDKSYLGRFSFDMLTELYGLQRVLTIIARGYLFCSGDPYDNIEHARRALCAWSSLPRKNPDREGDEWKFRINFGEYRDEFPELVTEDGKGWFYSHVRGIISYTDRQGKNISRQANSNSYFLQRDFRKKWYSKLKQLQIPIFSDDTKNAFVMTFDEIISDALAAGELRDKTFSFSADEKARITSALPNEVPYHAAEVLLAYCIANKPEDSAPGKRLVALFTNLNNPLFYINIVNKDYSDYPFPSPSPIYHNPNTLKPLNSDVSAPSCPKYFPTNEK